MSSKFNITGNIGIVGENITNSGTVVGNNAVSITNIDWNSISNEIKLLSESNKVDRVIVEQLNEAVAKKDANLLQKCLTAANLSKDFLISLGASLLANCMF